MGNMAEIKLIIFDLDGTLIDSLDDLTAAVNVMLDRFGRPCRTKDEIRGMVGQGARNLVERAMGNATLEEVDRALPVFLDYNLAHIADRTRLYPGVAETLTALKTGGRRFALISNKHERHCRTLLSLLGIEGYFERVMGADSYPVRKPSPEPLLKIMADFAVTAGATAMIGDSINDIAAGRGAGVVTIGCRFGYGDEAELAESDHIIDSFAQLLELPLFKPR